MRQVTAVVDFGTSHTVVVVSGPGLPPTLVTMDGAPWFPSAVFWRRDGRAILGAEAVELARTEPARLERHPKARIGEPEVLLGDSVVPTTLLVRAVLATVIAEAIQVTRAPIQHLVLTHPADWGSTRLGALMSAAQGLVPRLSTVPEPVGAAAWFTTRHEFPVGAALVVLDFGGGTCDAAVVRREPAGLSVVACAGLPDLGGEDLDQRIIERLRRVRPLLGELLDDAERIRPAVAAEISEIARLRENVRAAKEELSRHQQVDVPLPGGMREVLLTRQELEADIGADIDRAVELVAGAVGSSGLAAADLTAVHLVGGSSRIPLLAQRLRSRLPVPVLLDEQPEVVVALGAHSVAEPESEVDGDTIAVAVRRRPSPVPVSPEEPDEVARQTNPKPTRSAVAAGVAATVIAIFAALVGVGLFDLRVAGSAVYQPGAVPRLTLPAPRSGAKIEVAGHPTAELASVRAGEYVDIRNPFAGPTQWRLDAFVDSVPSHQQLVALGNAQIPRHRWVLVRVTEKITAAATAYQPARTYLVDDRGLMIAARDVGPKFPADCPQDIPAGSVAAGTEVSMCLIYDVPGPTPVVEVAVASLSQRSPTNLNVRESITNGGRVAVDGQPAGKEPPALPDDALPLGVPAAVRSNALVADVAVVDVLEDISGYFDVEYSNDKVIGLPGNRGVLVRIAARLTEPIDGTKLPLPTVTAEDDRGVLMTSPFAAHRNECLALQPSGQLRGTVAYCAFFALPPETSLRAVQVRFAPAEPRTWRVP